MNHREQNHNPNPDSRCRFEKKKQYIAEAKLGVAERSNDERHGRGRNWGSETLREAIEEDETKQPHP